MNSTRIDALCNFPHLDLFPHVILVIYLLYKIKLEQRKVYFSMYCTAIRPRKHKLIGVMSHMGPEFCQPKPYSPISPGKPVQCHGITSPHPSVQGPSTNTLNNRHKQSRSHIHRQIYHSSHALFCTSLQYTIFSELYSPLILEQEVHIIAEIRGK
jgi:hypothetical protein